MTEHEKAKRKRGSGSLRVRGGVFWLRYHHRGERVEESSGVRDDGTAEARNKALNKLRQKTKTADTEAHVPPSALRLTFEELMEMVRADYAEKGNRTADRLPTLCRRLADAFGGRKAMLAVIDPV